MRQSFSYFSNVFGSVATGASIHIYPSQATKESSGTLLRYVPYFCVMGCLCLFCWQQSMLPLRPLPFNQGRQMRRNKPFRYRHCTYKYYYTYTYYIYQLYSTLYTCIGSFVVCWPRSHYRKTHTAIEDDYCRIMIAYDRKIFSKAVRIVRRAVLLLLLLFFYILFLILFFISFFLLSGLFIFRWTVCAPDRPMLSTDKTFGGKNRTEIYSTALRVPLFGQVYCTQHTHNI